MTVHRSKGLEFPATWVPALQEGRFPSLVKSWGRTRWHLIPRRLVSEAQRYDSGVEDERRLFYVAITRAAKHLHCTWSPSSEQECLRQPSRFLRELAHSDYVLTCEPRPMLIEKLAPAPRTEATSITIPFTALKYWHACQYSFFLRYLYGFEPPLVEELVSGALFTTLSLRFASAPWMGKRSPRRRSTASWRDTFTFRSRRRRPATAA